MNSKRYLILLVMMIALLCLPACRKEEPMTTTTPATMETHPATEETQIQETIVEDGVIIGAGLEFEEEAEATETTETTPQETEEENQEITAPTEEKHPDETTAPTENQDSEETNPSTHPSGSASEYVAYMNMSAAEQAAFIDSFGSVDAFMAWFNKVKSEFDATDGSIDIGSGSVDLENILGGGK